MPGEQEKSVTVAAPEVVIGNVITNAELELHMLRNSAKPHPFAEYKVSSGDKYTFVFIERCGLGLYSHQDQRIWVFEFADMLRLAKAAGLDHEVPTIVVPGGHRG